MHSWLEAMRPDRRKSSKSGPEVVIPTPQGPVRLEGKLFGRGVRGRPGIEVVVTRTLVPLTGGTLEIDPASIVARRATRWQRDLFGQRIATAVAKLIARDAPRRMVVRPVPQAQRPESFAGAVGEGFTLEASADRTVVQVGEPITLDLVLRGEGALEAASLPRLDAEGLLPADAFRVPDSEPTGQVDGDAKRFRVTVRVLDEQVREVPPLEYSWFDPERGAFETTRSRPIALSVRPGRKVGAADVISRKPAPLPGPARRSEPAEGEGAEAAPRDVAFDASGADLAIERDVSSLLGGGGAVSGRLAATACYGLGLAFAFAGFWRGRQSQLDPERERVRSELASEVARIRAAAGAGGDGREAASELADALRRARALAPEVPLEDFDPVLGEVDALAYAPPGAAAALPAALLERAVALAEALEGTSR